MPLEACGLVGGREDAIARIGFIAQFGNNALGKLLLCLWAGTLGIYAAAFCLCHIRVVDRGWGFDFASLEEASADLSAERGRGIKLMHALVDRVKFVSKPEAGTIVHLEKHIEFAEGSLLSKAISLG